jgi:N utilization substance protein A
MKSEFLLAFNQICIERNLPPEVVLEALRTALVSAYRRNANVSQAQNVTAEIDPNSGQAAIYVEKEAVEEVRNHDTEVTMEVASKIDPAAQLNDTVMVESTPKDFGRIAAQTAKQVILQRIREAEREALYEDYADREGEIVNGVVQSVTPQSISLNLGRTEAILPRKEQVPGERYTLHQRLRAYVVEVKRSGRGPQIIVSRSHKNMLRRLLELEVPEIYNGAVEIRAIAREAGARSKVAVSARQPGVDPVGSCVGMRGVRIQSIVNELGGEKIDVIEWSPDPAVFIAKALSPARVLAVYLEGEQEEGRTATVVVPDDQLSLAIGREGQNARLGAKLTGWRIDIKSVSEAAREALAQLADETIRSELGHLSGVLPTVTAALEQRGDGRTSYDTEQLLLLRQVVDSVYRYFAEKRRAEREALLDHEASRRTALATEIADRRADREKALSRVPSTAYDIPLRELDLSSRVLRHMEKAQIENLGQVMERLVHGDEGLLALEGIGPKALAEIKAQIETKVPAMPEEPELQPQVEAEPEVVSVAEAAALPEEIVVITEPVSEEVPLVAEAPAETQAEVEVELPEVAAAEPAIAEVVVAIPELDKEQRRARREWALAHIPADAYDIPLAVLALSGQVLSSLKRARIENLGEIMERLAEGDEGLLAVEGIDSKALAEIKSQVEIMVSIPSAAPVREAPTAPAEGPRKLRIPRYEYVPDDEIEEKTKPKRQKKQKQRGKVLGKTGGALVDNRGRKKRGSEQSDDTD